MAAVDDQGWTLCVRRLATELGAHELETWIRPLQARRNGDRLVLIAPDRMVMERVRAEFLTRIQRAWMACESEDIEVDVLTAAETGRSNGHADEASPEPERLAIAGKLDPRYTFESFIQGKSNSQARAAAQQVAESPGVAYNPLLIYGATGLGKTHLMHAVGHAMIRRNGGARVVAVASEQWVTQYVSAVRHATIEEFKNLYRTADALLIDDIHFFAGKPGSQEEFFHTFNSLMGGNKQIILTSDKFPKDLDRLDDRLKTRFAWGLTVCIEPPDLETRVAILMSKAEVMGLSLPTDVAFFVAQHVKGNVRELEGTLLHMRLRGGEATMDMARQILRDTVAHYERKVTIDNIMSTVAKYYNIPVKDLRSPRRSRMLARPRQVAMALARELTEHSLPDIGQAFEKDHTTVLHADRKIKELRESDLRIREDYENLLKQLSY